MKKEVVALFLIGLSLTSFSQAETTKKERKTQFGFSLGGFQTLISPDKSKNGNIDIKNNSGFRLGILMNHKLGKKLSISPKAELAFSNGSVSFIKDSEVSLSKPLYNTHLEFMSHFVWSRTDLKINPYILIGPSVRVPLIKKNDVRITNNYDAGLDIGIGFNKALKHFNVAPELRLSTGFTNIFNDNTLSKTRYTSISLVLNFLG